MNQTLAGEGDLKYAAGFFDGEGCITIQTRSAGPSTGREYALQVMVSNTHRGIVAWWVSLFGGNITVRPDRRPNVATIFTWQARSRKAANCLTLIVPDLKIKREEAMLGLEFQSRISHRGPKRLSDDELAIRRDYRDRISALKQAHKVFEKAA